MEAASLCQEDHVLEIGCGWGSLAIHAVQVGLDARLASSVPDSLHASSSCRLPQLRYRGPA